MLLLKAFPSYQMLCSAHIVHWVSFAMLCSVLCHSWKIPMIIHYCYIKYKWLTHKHLLSDQVSHVFTDHRTNDYTSFHFLVFVLFCTVCQVMYCFKPTIGPMKRPYCTWWNKLPLALLVMAQTLKGNKSDSTLFIYSCHEPHRMLCHLFCLSASRWWMC